MMSQKFVCGLVFLLTTALTLVQSQMTETISTEYGAVVGQVINVNIEAGTFPVTTFYGIPYAHAPQGVLRFAPPTKHPGWTGQFVADELPDACMQNPAGLIWMTHPLWNKYSEDCLTVNIYKPTNVVAPLPVMVYFHGGGYTGGGNVQYPGHFMAARDVIVVTVNYRLGVFGFASTEDGTIKGNMGMLDQVQALQFVKDNIANFGGNPNRVTIFGQSAGASSSALHMVSPMSRGLYHQAILESGAENNVWTLNFPDQNPNSYIYQVADNLNCTYTNDVEVVACLRAASARDLRIADSIVCTPGYFCQGFAPIIDGPGGFIPEMPIEVRKVLGEASVPILSGICKDDGSLFTPVFIPEANEGGFTREEFQYYLRTRLVGIFEESVNDELMFENAYQAFDWFYTPWPYIDDLEANRQAVNKLLTDGAFGYPWNRNAKLNSEYRDTYTYIQSFLSPNSTSFIPAWMGVPHEGELPYVWGYGYLLTNQAVRDDSGIQFDIVGWVPEDATYANYVETLWTNFAKYGNPTPTPVQAPFNNTMTTWPKFTADDNLKVLDLNAEIVVKENYRQPENYFYTEYLKYIVKHPVKREDKGTLFASEANVDKPLMRTKFLKAPAPKQPMKKFQLKSSMFQDRITKQVHEMMTQRFPDMSHLSLEEFKQTYDV